METLGERLAAQRRKLGQSVIDVEAATNIRAGLIEALEAGEYDRLPSPAYVRGYIQSYAKFLELPIEPLLRAYEEETGAKPAPSKVGELPADQVVPRREHAHGLSMRTAALIAAGIAALALAVWGIGRIISGPPESATPPVPTTAEDSREPTSTTETETAPSVEPTAPVTGEGEGEDATTPTDEPRPFTLTIEVDKGSASWMVVTVDGEREHVGTLDGGEKLTYEVSEEVTIAQIGKPGSVTIERDGEEVEIPSSADVPELTLKAE